MWVILSILSGLGDSFAFIAMKKLKNLNPYIVLGLHHISAIPFIMLGFLFYEVPKVAVDFYIVVLINSIIMIIAMLFLIKSLHISDLSLSIPMLSFTPAFLLVTSYFMLKEYPNFLGFVGIILTVADSYVINISHIKNGYLEPFKKIFKNRGVLYMIITSFLFSITSNLVKIGINLSNPAYFMFVTYLLISILIMPVFLKKTGFKELKFNSKWILILGISTAVMEMLIAVAVKFAIIPYIISLKRTSVIFSVIIGAYFFKEKNFKATIMGSAIMFFGALLITLS